MKKIIPIILFLFIASFSFWSQEDSDYKKYRKNRLSPFVTCWHEIHISSKYAFDLDYFIKEDRPTLNMGNLGRGLNAGTGLGYMFSIGIDDTPFYLGLGLKAEYFPGTFFKYNVMFDMKVLGLAYKDFGAVFIDGGEFNITFDNQHDQKEMHTTVYLLSARYKNLELKYGLQSWNDKYIPIIFLDDAFTLFQLTYKFII
ncbi:MAG: hypothetical protein ACI9N1_001519 [Flavobacteriales bacterium]|jgi:hypothetical protein